MLHSSSSGGHTYSVLYVPCGPSYALGAVLFTWATVVVIVYMGHVIPYDATSASSDRMAGTGSIYMSRATCWIIEWANVSSEGLAVIVY